MIESPDPTRADPPRRANVIPFPGLRRRRHRWWLGVSMGPVGCGGLDLGWHLMLAAPVWWWQAILAVLWLGFLGIVGAFYHMLWHAGDNTPRSSDRR